MPINMLQHTIVNRQLQIPLLRLLAWHPLSAP
jgi:hypothetical protein